MFADPQKELWTWQGVALCECFLESRTSLPLQRFPQPKIAVSSQIWPVRAIIFFTKQSEYIWLTCVSTAKMLIDPIIYIVRINLSICGVDSPDGSIDVPLRYDVNYRVTRWNVYTISYFSDIFWFWKPFQCSPKSKPIIFEEISQLPTSLKI